MRSRSLIFVSYAYYTLLRYHCKVSPAKKFCAFEGEGSPQALYLLPLLPSQALRASSPPGRAKCTPVDRGKLCGKANKTAPFAVCTAEGAVFMPSQSRFARQLPRKRGSQNVTFRLGLPRVRGRWPAGPERATNNAGPAFRPTPQRDPIFRDAKVLLFWCDQQQKE